MEFWFIALVVALAVIIGWGSISTINRKKLAARQQRWRELDDRFTRVTMESTRYETDPQRALDAPGWLDRKNPLVRGFSGTLKRAQQRRAELERDVPHTPVRRQKSNTPAEITSSASALAPREEDLEAYQLLVEHLEEAYEETDRAVRMTGWSQPGAEQLPHPQFMLDHRWGRPAIFPDAPAMDSVTADSVVRTFLNASYPVHRDAAVKAIKHRSGSGARKVQKSIEHLLATHRYVIDQHGILWPSSVRVHDWGVHRTFGRSAEVGLDQVPAVEVANAAWVLLDEQHLEEKELIAAVKDRLELNNRLATGLSKSINVGIAKGMQALPDSMQDAIHGAIPNGVFNPATASRTDQLLHAGIREGLVSGRLQRQSDGRIGRLREGWPTSYR